MISKLIPSLLTSNLNLESKESTTGVKNNLLLFLTGIGLRQCRFDSNEISENTKNSKSIIWVWENSENSNSTTWQMSF